MTTRRPPRNYLLASFAERLEPKTVLSGSAIVQPFSDVEYFGDADDWSLNAVNAPEVWSQGYTGDEIVVAVIDTGVDLRHQDLVHSLWVNETEIADNGIDDDENGFVDDTQGWDFVDNDAVPQDGYGHGTRVAGAIAAARNDIGATGIAYDATIMPIRVLNDKGIGSQVDIGEGIRYAVDNGADIINLSFGGLRSRRVSAAIHYAGENGVLVVAAAGNSSDTEPVYPARYSSTYENVISVGAFASDMNRADFSNLVGESEAVQVDAPGVAIHTTVMQDSYGFSSGTSLAAPHVSGIAALALSADRTLAPDKLRSILLEGAKLEIADSDSQGGVNAAYTVALAARSFAPSVLPGDIDRDGIVGFGDFLLLARAFGRTVEIGGPGDLNHDAQVGFDDFLILANNFGRSAASAEPPVDTFYADEVGVEASVEAALIERSL